ncbi:hypothetical protein KTQ42_08830|uniref:hypothetical protein n=1 Tax=Noviherbaspirillum sp. L7-7A TaxID=2850560 RepID=UPI001C2BFABA|nr:hypothetical protein [Noviherbaspirillum sp. L7-7A]MBV0879406.1 hypothetical protein [Noviherbaspirillum sp. L7-7A]
MAITAPNTEVVAASIDTIVTINGVRNTIKQFVMAGAIRMIGNKFIFVGPADLIGSMPAESSAQQIIAKGFPMRQNTSVVASNGYNEVQIAGEWMLMSEAFRRGLV